MGVTDIDQILNIKKGFYYNYMKELILEKVEELPQTVLYWILPAKFLGRKVNLFQLRVIKYISFCK